MKKRVIAATVFLAFIFAGCSSFSSNSTQDLPEHLDSPEYLDSSEDQDASIRNDDFDLHDYFDLHDVLSYYSFQELKDYIVDRYEIDDLYNDFYLSDYASNNSDRILDYVRGSFEMLDIYSEEEIIEYVRSHFHATEIYGISEIIEIAREYED